MAKLKITFKKEVWADLNAYYPNFPAALRKAIDNAVYRLLGGQETGRLKYPSDEKRNKISGAGVSKAVILKRTPKECSKVNSKTAAFVKNYEPGHEYMKEDVQKKALTMYAGAVMIHALVRDGYFEVVK